VSVAPGGRGTRADPIRRSIDPAKTVEEWRDVDVSLKVSRAAAFCTHWADRRVLHFHSRVATGKAIYHGPYSSLRLQYMLHVVGPYL